MPDPWHAPSSDKPLAQFPRGHRLAATERSSRVIAGVLTAAVYALFVLIWHGPFWKAPDPIAAPEIVATIVPEVPIKQFVLPPPPPFLTRLIKPPVQSFAPPAFTIAPEPPPAPALLAASAADTSSMAGGAPAGTATGTGLSANGTNGNGIGLSGCFDAVWARSVRDHIGRFFFYPVRAWKEHATGAVMVHMMVRRNGKLNKLDVLESSGNAILDKAATDIVRNAVPLPRIPYRMHVDQVDAKMLIAFGPPVTDHPSPDSCGR